MCIDKLNAKHGRSKMIDCHRLKYSRTLFVVFKPIIIHRALVTGGVIYLYNTNLLAYLVIKVYIP